MLFYLKPNIDYSNKFIVFTEQQLKLQEDLKIIFTKNNKEFGLINSETATIKQLNNNNAVLQFENNISRAIPLSALQHVDYGYCITVHSSQGKTYAHTIAAIENHKLLNEQKSWLVALSRHKNELSILTQDKQQLEKTLMKNDGVQMSAIELKSLADSEAKELSLPKQNQINDNQNVSKSLGKKFEMEM